MSVLQAIIIGIIQGLSEFIPISSTAHMTITGSLMGLINKEHPEQWTAFMAVVQLGTLAAVFVYFAADIRSITLTFLRENIRLRMPLGEQISESRMGWLVIAGSIPIVVIGLALKKIIEGEATKDMTLIALMLIAVSVVLFIAERVAKLHRTMRDLTWRDAFAVGAAQALALLPGASRSGTTISAGLFLGMTRETAARFSFLLSIPAIAGSGILEFVKSLKYLNGNDALALAVATIVAGVVGYYAIAFLMRYLRTKSTMVFIVYRVVLAVVILLFLR